MRTPSRTIAKARSLRRAMTLPEVLLWRNLRRCAMGGLRFRRQHPVGPYVLDFFCAEARLAIEVDGAAHDNPDRARRDAMRDGWLADRRITVLRFAAVDILDDSKRVDVVATIVAAARAPSTASGGPPPPLRG